VRSIVKRTAIIAGVGAGLAIWRLAPTSSNRTSHSNPAAITAAGNAILSLFSGVEPRASLKPVATGGKAARCVSAQDRWVGGLRRFLHVEPVFAITCTASDCSGHWMAPEPRDCPSFHAACTDGQYEYFVVDFFQASYSDGYRYTGDTVCGPCRCEEEHCNW